MVNKIPESWDYNDSLEMLYLFYQCSDELLSEVTPDSFSLPLHNTLTLIQEMVEVYEILEQHGIVKEYYDRYLPPIIEEFIQQTDDDYLFKNRIGIRLHSIRTGFEEAKVNSTLLNRWIDNISQAITLEQYLLLYRNEIIRLITSTKDKNKLLYCTSNYYITLRWMGYSREYLYTTTKKFFDNANTTINNTNQIKDFLTGFSVNRHHYEFLILMDIDSIDYMDSISDNKIFNSRIDKVDVSKERNDLIKDAQVSQMLKDYDGFTHEAGSHKKMAIVRLKSNAYDPYSAAIEFSDFISYLQTFTRYFKHFYYTKQIYRILLKLENDHYREIKIPNKLQKRPFVKQEVIDSRIRNIVDGKSMDISANFSITQAIIMHAEALDSRNMSTMLKSFWTALETLFSNPNTPYNKDNVISSVLPIVQKTYILKKLRAVYMQLIDSTTSNDRVQLNIETFPDFLIFFASYSPDSEQMKKVYALLNNNLLLRSRLYSIRKSLNSGKSIHEMLAKHDRKIEQQLKRLYRLRNMATHIGETITGTDVAVNHLHNYFDFIVNYMLCKSEYGDHVVSTSAVAFEAKNDNSIYNEILKNNDKLTENNYLELLFGPDRNLVHYQFEY